VALAIYIALLDAITKTAVLNDDFWCHITETLILLKCEEHDWECILPVSLNPANMTAYLCSSAPHGTATTFTPLSWWATTMTSCLHIAKDPTIGAAEAIRVVCCDSRSTVFGTMTVGRGGPWRCMTTPQPARVKRNTPPHAPKGTCTFYLKNMRAKRKLASLDEYAFELDLDKSIICSKEQPDDTPFSSIDNTPVVDTNLLRQIMLTSLPEARKKRMEEMMVKNKENENKENETTPS
jgi:hypothetical protein